MIRQNAGRGADDLLARTSASRTAEHFLRSGVRVGWSQTSHRQSEVSRAEAKELVLLRQFELLPEDITDFAWVLDLLRTLVHGIVRWESDDEDTEPAALGGPE